jgi:3-oxoadipate enol-lactonase / 4-carboxymuconolactone decarboxylase
MHVRETVLGSEHLSRVKGNANSFTHDFQEMIAELPWGTVWTRPGLNKHQRSLITLSALIAMDKQEEFKMHVRAAFNNGVTTDELKELIVQSAIYCGFPAANSAFKAAEEVLKEMNISY